MSDSCDVFDVVFICQESVLFWYIRYSRLFIQVKERRKCQKLKFKVLYLPQWWYSAWLCFPTALLLQIFWVGPFVRLMFRNASNGDVMACRRVTDSGIANIFEDRLADVWVCQMEKYREYDRFIKCSKCELKAWCRGCPAVANGTNGDFYGADPQCWKIKNERTGERLSQDNIAKRMVYILCKIH